ncbi:uncharacterized protein LOC104860346 [Fukomys damarensis]|uniref:uncharacterized protein LOC104860346 n=1 Tax=Fukomys damarensis TaxID=885580 RepID=UPI00053FE29B|nr:uncharacterized protein LOC104860346 [Fukomys damarensis]
MRYQQRPRSPGEVFPEDIFLGLGIRYQQRPSSPGEVFPEDIFLGLGMRNPERHRSAGEVVPQDIFPGLGMTNPQRPGCPGEVLPEESFLGLAMEPRQTPTGPKEGIPEGFFPEFVSRPLKAKRRPEEISELAMSCAETVRNPSEVFRGLSTSHQETPGSPTHVQPGLSTTLENHSAGSLAQVWPVQVVTLHSLSEQLVPAFPGSQPFLGSSFLRSTRACTYAQQARMMGRAVSFLLDSWLEMHVQDGPPSPLTPLQHPQAR